MNHQVFAEAHSVESRDSCKGNGDAAVSPVPALAQEKGVP